MDFKNISDLNSSHYENLSLDKLYYILPTLSLNVLDVATVVIYVVVFVVGVPGNLLVFWVTGSKAQRSINAIWFLNLAVADLLSCLVLPIHIMAIFMQGYSPLDKKICSILHSFFDFNLYVSILFLATLSADHFLIVFQPLWCQKYHVALQAWLASGVAWILALVLTIPSFVYRECYETSVSKRVFCFVVFVNSSVKLAVTITQFVLTFLGPLVTMNVCYIFLLLQTWRQLDTRSTKTLKVVVAVVTSFFVFWLPYQVLRMDFAVSTLTYHSIMDESPYRLDMALAYVNCCISPVIYVAAAWGMHIQVFKFRSDRLCQLLTES